MVFFRKESENGRRAPGQELRSIVGWRRLHYVKCCIGVWIGNLWTERRQGSMPTAGTRTHPAEVGV